MAAPRSKLWRRAPWQRWRHRHELAAEVFGRGYLFFSGPIGYRTLDWEDDAAGRHQVLGELAALCLGFAGLSRKERSWYGPEIHDQMAAMADRLVDRAHLVSNQEVIAFVKETVLQGLGWAGT
jgi:hypothetical protein